MKLELKKDPTLKDFQDYIALMVRERGFDDQTTSDVFMKFLEESGEMAKAAKHASKEIMKDKTRDHEEIDSEIADVFIYLLDIANRFEVDLEQAFREKEKINQDRTWAK
ncbi:MAG: RS21-C6 protein [Parcubacteria group bacterium]|nr:RS21-C6 protein [Parcubacteria group bacterium]